MKIHDYETTGGKNAIKEYLSALPENERFVGYSIRHKIVLGGLEALKELDTRQLRGKLWEIKFSKNRIMYAIADSENIHFLHACQKQKGKSEKFELETAIQRAKEKGFDI
ncbi:MAG: type II toxin-antitoxin system RelE/ParE family toxin [Oscillospiraceae bacterium]|nr:type II toxin-antitoxin system RelE/ParE family toxin [Oscillospiraceae bacterium]